MNLNIIFYWKIGVSVIFLKVTSICKIYLAQFNDWPKVITI